MTHANPTRPRRTTPRPARRRHDANFADAVVAVYIHEISARSRRARAPVPVKRAT